MRILVIDTDPKTREVLVTRLREALRQADRKRAEIVSGGLELLSSIEGIESASLGFIGPGCYQELESAVSRFRAVYPDVPLGVVLENSVYATQALELRRYVSARIMPLADIAQMAQFVLDGEAKGGSGATVRNRGVIAVTQCKGGVGVTSVALALAACWAKHELSVALLDLDDFNPQLTVWAKSGASERRAVLEFLQAGAVPKHRLKELLTVLESYERRLAIVAQPEQYQESFQFKADVIEGAPSSADYIQSLIPALQEEFDIVIVDAGRSWGVATFALLPLCQQVLLVVDEDRTTVERSLDNLKRMYRESDDHDEFAFARWRVLVNGFSGKAFPLAEIKEKLSGVDLFPEALPVFTLPYSSRGRGWTFTEQSLYENSEDRTKDAIRDLAFSLIPFRQAGPKDAARSKNKSGLRAMFGG